MFTFKLKQRHTPSSCPELVNLDNENIYANDVCIPREFDEDAGMNTYNTRLFVIGAEHGPICAVWANCAQAAFDAAVNLNALDSLLIEEKDLADYPNATGLGNASEPFDLDNAWIGEVEWDAARDILALIKFARAAESSRDTLAF